MGQQHTGGAEISKLVAPKLTLMLLSVSFPNRLNLSHTTKRFPTASGTTLPLNA
jgi:hypothetical protein